MQQKAGQVTSSLESIFFQVMQIDLLELLVQKTLCLYHVYGVCQERHSATKAYNLFLIQGASQNKEDPSLFCCALLVAIQVNCVLLKFIMFSILSRWKKKIGFF